MTVRFIAVDPGEVYCGIASLTYDAPLRNGTHTNRSVQSGEIRTDARVLHIPERGSVNVTKCIAAQMPANLIVEEYRVRPVGHQRFHTGDTLRLMGMLEFASVAVPRSTYHTIPATSDDTMLAQLSDGFLETWYPDWPHEKNDNWNHARSAWRVLLRHLMQHHPYLLSTLQNTRWQRGYERMVPTFPIPHKQPKDLLAPGGRWAVPRAIPGL